MGLKTETGSKTIAPQTRKGLAMARETLVGIATERFIKEKEGQSPLFLYDLIFATTAYLKDREVGFGVADIMAAWKKPSLQKKSVAYAFFSERIFPLFHDATIDEKELDYLVSAFLSNVATTISLNTSIAMYCAKERKVRDSTPSA